MIKKIYMVVGRGRLGDIYVSPLFSNLVTANGTATVKNIGLKEGKEGALLGITKYEIEELELDTS